MTCRGRLGHRLRSQGTAGLLGSIGVRGSPARCHAVPPRRAVAGAGRALPPPPHLPSSSEPLQGFLWPWHRRLLPYVVTSSHAPLPPGHGTANGTALQSRAQHRARPRGSPTQPPYSQLLQPCEAREGAIGDCRQRVLRQVPINASHPLRPGDGTDSPRVGRAAAPRRTPPPSLSTHSTTAAAASLKALGRLCREQLLRSNLGGAAPGAPCCPSPLPPPTATLTPRGRRPRPAPYPIPAAHPTPVPVTRTPLPPHHPPSLCPYPSRRCPPDPRPTQQRPHSSVPALEAQYWATTEPLLGGPAQLPHSRGGVPSAPGDSDSSSSSGGRREPTVPLPAAPPRPEAAPGWALPGGGAERPREAANSSAINGARPPGSPRPAGAEARRPDPSCVT